MIVIYNVARTLLANTVTRIQLNIRMLGYCSDLKSIKTVNQALPPGY